MKFGPWEVTLFPAGRFRLDGGAMFGTVPKTLWARLMPPDDQNRIYMTTNALLGIGDVEGQRRVVVVETGCGTKGDDTFRERLAIEDEQGLLEGLAARGIAPEDVTDVCLTHLHLDHAGGATRRDPSGALVPTFPNARHWVSRQDLEDAQNPPPRAKPSYLRDDFMPLLAAGLVSPVEGEAELLPGLSMRPLPGHNRGNMGVVFHGGGRKLVYTGDLIPTRHHLQPTWAMAYDLDVNTCVETRTRLLEELAGTDDLIAFDHELEQPVGRVLKDAKGRYLFEPVAL